MKVLPILFLLFLLGPHLQAQQDQEHSLEKIERLNIDSLEVRTRLDSLIQSVSASKSEAIDSKYNLNNSIDLPDTLLHNNPADKINQKKEAAQQNANAAKDSLKQKLQVKIPDSLINLVPKEAGVLPGVEIPELDIKPLEELKGISEIDQLKSVNKIENIKTAVDIETIPELDLEQVGVITDKVDNVKEKLVSPDKIGETVENEAKNLKGIRALDKQKGELEGAMPDFYKFKDSEHYKEELVNKVKEKAVNHFVGHADKLQAAQSKLADIKKKYPEGVSSIKDLPKRRPNPLKGKPFTERFLLGLTVQIHPDQIPNVDVSPFTAFKLSQRLSFGVGGTYRLMTREDFKGITSEGAVYGYRGFTELLLQKGFFVHAEYEILKTLVRDSLYTQVTEKLLEKEWISGLLIGIGREYKIGGLVKGNMQVLYNFLHEPNSPYQEKVMVRFGFSFQPKNRKKKIISE